MAQITLTLDFTPENVEALRKLAEELNGKTTGGPEQMHLNNIRPQDAEKPPAKPAAAKPKTGAAKKEEKKTEPPAEALPDEGETTISLTEVRAVALKLSQSGKQTALQGIFAKYGAKKLSDVPQAKYPALMKELEEAVNG